MSMQDYVHFLFLSVSFPKRTKHKYWEIIPAGYNSVNGYNHNYKFCLTFSSQVTVDMWQYLGHKVLSLSGAEKST